MAHPDRAYPCSGMQSYWGIPADYARYMEMERYEQNKGAPENENQFGSPGNRHPSFLGFGVSPSCTDDMVHFLQLHSNMFSHEEHFFIDDIELPVGIDKNGYEACFSESLANRGLDTRSDGFVPEPITRPEPEPSPEQTSVEERLHQEKKDHAKIQTQNEIMMDFRGNQHQIDAINQYLEEFEPGYFLEQSVIPNKQNFEKDKLINFVVVQWGYQPEKCVSFAVTGYFKPYSNYEDPFYAEKISEWKDTNCESVIGSDSNGHLIVNMHPMPGIPEEHQACSDPGEYRILVKNLNDESQVEWGYFTCQSDKLTGESQPWMEIPE